MTTLYCPGCRTSLVLPTGAIGRQTHTCVKCHEPCELELFPALWRLPATGRAGERITGEEAGCYVHADRRAEAACEHCGRFMCAMCEVHVGEKRLCMTCFEEGRKGRKLPQTERHRLIHVQLALWIALASIFFGPLGVVGGVPALCLAIFGLCKPRSITGHRYVVTAVLAILASLLTIAISVVFWSAMITAAVE